MTKRKSKPVKKVEEQTIETEPLVTPVNEVIPESPELSEQEIKDIEESEKEFAEGGTKIYDNADELITDLHKAKIEEESTVECVVSDIADGMVTAKAIVRNMSFIDPVDGDIKHVKKGEVFTTTKERVDSLDQRFIKRL